MSDTIKGALIIAAAIVWAGESMRFRPSPDGLANGGVNVVDGRTGEVRNCNMLGCMKRVPAPETDTFSPYVPVAREPWEDAPITVPADKK
jgi:hypothetical protein